MTELQDDLTKLSKLFWQASFKLQFAADQFASASALCAQFLHEGHAGVRQEFDPSTSTYRLFMFAERLPGNVPMLIGGGIHSLRSALDTAVSMLVREAGADGELRVNFPVHGSQKELIASFGDGKRTCPDCKVTRPQKATNRIIRQKLPDLERIIIEVFQAWRDGNYPLWALSKLDNLQKHQNLLLVATTNSLSVDFYTAEGYISQGCLWKIQTGQTVEIAASRSEITLTSEPSFGSELLFPEGIPFGGKPVFEVLEELFELVRGILVILQAHFEGDQSAFADGTPSSFKIAI